jgi:glycosyltransferase domain-containing protein
MYKFYFKKTTLLITLKDEKELTKRLIKYLNNQSLKINILIADGSINKQQKLCYSLKHKYKYFYFGEDKNHSKYFLKIYLALKKIKTDFVLFCDQDDFVNFECLKKKENFLIQNSIFSAAKGIIYNFKSNKKKNLLMERSYNKEIINNKSTFKRLKNNFHFRSYYCLHRTKNLEKFYNLVIKHKLNDARSAEFIVDVGTLLVGQVHLDNECSLLRCSDNKYIVHPISLETRLEWFFKRMFTNNKILKDILNINKTIRLSLFSFKIMILVLDIIPNLYRQKAYRFNYLISRILFKSGIRINNNGKKKYFRFYETKKIFNLLNDHTDIK